MNELNVVLQISWERVCQRANRNVTGMCVGVGSEIGVKKGVRLLHARREANPVTSRRCLDGGEIIPHQPALYSIE